MSELNPQTPPAGPPHGPPPSSYSPYPPQQQWSPAAPKNGIATAAGVLGIISIFIFGLILGILAIIFGSIGLRNANRMGGLGRGMALTGIVCGIIGLVAWIVIIALIFGASRPAGI
ncbi:MAG: DUF4190 domain-containing protein [Candidatus Dormibacteraeota bacterium]|nr:DUF4190 domain-containing protein [Candidatus Dormibacteraeota bacterium]MBV9525949.1 DUF4190 domain-containing protein [Candidatus Dormibacteraeota bacterium]